MSLEKALRDMVRQELAVVLSPLREAVGRMEGSLGALDSLRAISERLIPLSSRLGSMAGVRSLVEKAAPAQTPAQAPARGRGRPPARAKVPAPAVEAKAPRARETEEGRACAVKNCSRPARSKGYCSAHYQKLRLLIKTDRRPADWVDDAKPRSVNDVKLPRGRAAAQARESAPVEPPAPAKPKAWLRKKGKQGMVSLHG